MADDDRLSDVDRRSLRILARSSKSSASGTRLTERLERAAESGLRLDYQKAEQTFDSLPIEDRLRISAKAEKQAESERAFQERRKRATPPRTDPLSGDAPLNGQPIFEPAAANPPPKLPPRAESAPAAEDGMTWKLGAIPGSPKMPTAGRVARAPAPKPVPPAADDRDPEDEQKDWDWRKIPEDPVLNGGRKKAAAADPIEELRRQMLGLDAKYGKR